MLKFLIADGKVNIGALHLYNSVLSLDFSP